MMKVWITTVFVVWCCSSVVNVLAQDVSVSRIDHFNVGLFIPLKTSQNTADSLGMQLETAIIMAMKEVNNKSNGLYPDILPATELRYLLNYPKKSATFTEGANGAMNMAVLDNGETVITCMGPATGSVRFGK